MFFPVVSEYLAYTLVTAFTPGPSNIVALYAISQNGWKKGGWTIMGLMLSFLLVMMACGFFCYELAASIPSITTVMKYVGAGYVFWLAYHVAVSRNPESEGHDIGFWKAFFMQCLNFKIILYAITVYTVYVLPATQEPFQIFLHGLSLTVIGAAGTFAWAGAGGVLQRFLAKYDRPFNLAMGLILAVCAVKMLL